MKIGKMNILIIGFLVLITSFNLFAQNEINVGADLVSRYVWRGLDFGDSPSIQPTIYFTTSKFEIGAWGAYQLGRDASSAPADEIDLFLGYTFDSKNGSFKISVVDYYFPNSGLRFGEVKDGEGAHTLEGILSYEGPKSFPIAILVGVNFYNDSGYNSYFELGYSTMFKEVGLKLFVGATPGSSTNSIYYGTEKFAVINVGVSASKNIKITDDFSLPIFSSFILNPNQDIAHLVFGISI